MRKRRGFVNEGKAETDERWHKGSENLELRGKREKMK